MSFKVLALLTVRNAAEYLPKTLMHLINQGIEICLVDNGSVDATVEVAEKFLSSGKLHIESLPYVGRFELTKILQNEHALSKKIKADWYIHYDADELRYAPNNQERLVDAIKKVDDQGFNAINFDEFVFYPTESDDVNCLDFEDRIRHYYYFAPRRLHRLNAWKANLSVDLLSGAGHQIRAENLKIYPESFTLKHYIALSQRHLVSKYVNRIYSFEEMIEKQWHGARVSFNGGQLNVVKEMLKYDNSGILDKSSPLVEHPFLSKVDVKDLDELNHLLQLKLKNRSQTSKISEKLRRIGVLKSHIAPAPFIVGVMRSGTTLLRLMLDAHPEIAIPPETRFFPEIKKADERKNLSPMEIVDFFKNCHTWPDFEIEETKLHEALVNSKANTLADGLIQFYGLYAAKQGKPKWGDKTPYYGLYMHQIMLMVPQARFIHIIRDGRDVAVSTRGLWFDLGKTVEETAINWCDRIRQTRQLSQVIPWYMELRYEDLITDTENNLKKICDFLHLTYSPKMLDYYESANFRLDEFKSRYSDSGEVVVSKERRKNAFRLASLPPQKDRIGRWRNELSFEEVKIFNEIARPLLTELGYEAD